MTYLSRSQTNGSSRKKFTVSAWIKLGVSDNIQKIFDGYDGGGTYFYFAVETVGNGHVLIVKNESNGTNCNIKTSRTFRDPAAWYNFVLQVDTTQGTAANRVKIYVNGVQETSFSASTYPNQNRDFWVSVPSGATYYVGGRTAETIYSMSHFHYIDGSIIAVGQFGSVDSTTGEWKLNTSPTVSSYGTNGFAILKDGTTITDQSPNSNNYSSNGTALTKTEDCPDNNFATFNPLCISRGQIYGNGNNNTTTVPNAAQIAGSSTLGMSSGKYYAEFQLYSFNTNRSQIGVADNPTELDRANTVIGESTYSIAYAGENGDINANSSGVGSGSSYTTNDIIGVALNLDDNNILFYKNGTVQNSGTAISITASSSTTTGFYFFAVGNGDTSYKSQYKANFGEGFFGTTAAGTNADGNGQGLFAYAVPSGYYALNTKNLEAYG